MAHPIRLEENYPSESRRLNEEGVCKVRLTVDAHGLTQLALTHLFTVCCFLGLKTESLMRQP